MSFKLSPVSPEKVLQLSNGEVRIDETISFKSKLPIEGGLFCQKIFGPIKDYTCQCGKYEGKKFAGHICENCGVSVISSKSRSERMGHINLQLPIINPISVSALISILDTKPNILDLFLTGSLCCFFNKVVSKPNIVLKDGTKGKVRFVKLDDPILETSDQEYYDSSLAIYNIIKEIDLDETAKINSSKYLKIYQDNSFDLKNLFLLYLPVSPPNYRPLRETDTHYSTDPANDLYLRICRRAIRLKRVIELEAIKEIISHENNLIYKAVHQLFFGGAYDGKGNKLKGILEKIGGKEGFVRQTILGKRVDYSGRSAITSGGDTVEMDQLGIPRIMAYELFKPFIISEILESYAETYKEAIAIYEQKSHIAIKSMEKVVRGRRVLMNRAPTLHRYGIMSFRIKLVDGETIFVHPMICAPFNADFDGDQVAIHVPLSSEALTECDELMAPHHNILSSLDGQSQLNPSHEMVIGLDIMTNMVSSNRYTTIFNSLDKVEYLYNTFDREGKRNLNVNEEILWKDNNGVRTSCYGRLIIEKLLRTTDLPPRFTKGSIRSLIGKSYDKFESEELLKVLHELMKVSLNFVTLSGFSISSKDCIVPNTKKDKVQKAKDTVKVTNLQFEDGLITEERRYEENVRLWDNLVKELQEDWKSEVPEDNCVKMMQATGARVSMTQVSQLNVAKGLTTKTNNKIVEEPIINSLKEGLTTYEYFASCNGSRKSMADKASLTPDSGYLTRRMVTVSRDFFIVKDDCGTTDGINKVKKNCAGRFTCDGEFILPNDSEDTIQVRTPIFCKAEKGLCAKCYGLNTGNRKLVTIGTNIGTIAAQSLTESTTQMTMKTFHTSGAAVVKGSPLFVNSKINGIVSVSSLADFTRIDVRNNEQFYSYYVDSSRAIVSVKEGSNVSQGEEIALYTHESLQNDDVSGSLPKVMAMYEASIPTNSKECLIATKSGLITLELENKNIFIYIDGELVGISSKVPVFVAEGERVELGQILTYGAPNIGTFYSQTEDLATTYKIFESSVLDICEKEDLFPNPIHLEVIFRCMSNLVMQENGLYGLRSHGDTGKIDLMGIRRMGRLMPSWLKSMGFGYTTKTIQSSATELRSTYDLSSERLMYGGLIFDHKNISGTN